MVTPNEQNITIIAEIGVNHNGKLSNAFSLIDSAARSGADVVKFQTFSAESLTNANAPLTSYQFANTEGVSSQKELLQKLELTRDMHLLIIEHCEQNKIEFLSTAFGVEELKFLIEHGIKRIKIPSGELTNLPYLEVVASASLPVILSTGMSTIPQIRASVNILQRNGLDLEDLTILHCTTDYPAPFHTLNMSAISTIKREFGSAVGYSDHSEGNEAAVMAIALGATTIEKHITIDRNMPGPDHRASMEPVQFFDYVSSIRNASLALGNGIKQPSPAELENSKIVCKSIVAKKSIKQGELLTSENLTTKRPGTGISPMHWYDVMGKPAIRDFEIDELIEI